MHSTKSLISDLTKFFFEKPQKVSENGQKIKTLTFLRSISFCKKDVAAYTGKFLSILFLLNPKSYVWDINFWEK